MSIGEKIQTNLDGVLRLNCMDYQLIIIISTRTIPIALHQLPAEERSGTTMRKPKILIQDSRPYKSLLTLNPDLSMSISIKPQSSILKPQSSILTCQSPSIFLNLLLPLLSFHS